MSKNPAPFTAHQIMQGCKPGLRKLAFTIYDQPVQRTQTAPYYEVRHKGTMIEYTDKRADAYDAWKQEPKVSTCVRIDLVGGRAVRRPMQFNFVRGAK